MYFEFLIRGCKEIVPAAGRAGREKEILDLAYYACLPTGYRTDRFIDIQ